MSAIILRIIKREAPSDGTRDTCLQAPSTAQCVIISMFHFSIPQVFQLIEWSKTTHLLYCLLFVVISGFTGEGVPRNMAQLFWFWHRMTVVQPGLRSTSWRWYGKVGRLNSCELRRPFPNLHHGIPWKCTVDKPHQRHWRRQRVTMPGVSDLFKKLKRMYKWKPDVNSRIGLSTGLVSQLNPTLASASFFPKEKLSRRLIGPAPRDSEGDGWSKRSKCTLGFQVYPES